VETPAKRSEEQFDITIAFNGTWMHQGAPMTRMPLVRLFATVLQRDAAGQYWLVTPAERGRIDVADAPFIITGWRAENRGTEDQRLYLTDNLGREVPVDTGHPLTLRIPRMEGGVFVPYHQLGGGIEARVGTAVYYDLVDLALQLGGTDKSGRLHVQSFKTQHPVGMN
jgi:hypothetical protein